MVRRLDVGRYLVGEVRLVDRDESGLAVVEGLAEILQSAARDAAAGVARDAADHRSAGACRGEPYADRRKQRGDDADRQAPTEADGGAVPGRLFVLLDD